jgi:TPR repeat protein
MNREADILYLKAKVLSLSHGHDPAELFALLYAAAVQWHPEAQLEIGKYYQTGKVTGKNLPKAAYYYKLSSLNNNPEAQVLLAKCYLDNPDLYELNEFLDEEKKDVYYYEKKAFDLLKKSAKKNYANAFYELAEFLEKRKGGLDKKEVGYAGDGFDEERKDGCLTIDEQITSKSLKMFLKAAELGSFAAQRKVFWYYLIAKIGDCYDTEKISYWLRKLYQHPEQTSETLNDLSAILYKEAKYIESKYYHDEKITASLHFFEPKTNHEWINFLYNFSLDSHSKAFKMGCEKSGESAGLIYTSGPDSIRDHSKAYQLFVKSNSYSYLAHCHARGIGCSLNFNEAIRLMEKGCEIAIKSNPWELNRVTYDLGNLYEQYGEGDCFENAYKSYSRGRSSQCKYQVGLCHLDGKGIAKNESLALELFREASSSMPHVPIGSKIFSTSNDDRSAHGPYGLAMCFYKGLACEKNNEIAFRCLSRAVSVGKFNFRYICPTEEEVYKESLFMLGLFWEKGFGCKQDFSNSSYFYCLAARLGHKQSMLNLSNLLHRRAENKISFNLFHQQHYYFKINIGSDMDFSEHLKSLVLSSGSIVICDDDMPFASILKKDERPYLDELKGKIYNLYPSSSSERKFNKKLFGE